MGQLIAGPDDSSANLEHGLSCNESSESSLHSPTLGASAFGSTDTYGRLWLVPLATCLRLAPHQLREIRKSTGKLISKETMLLKPALPSESRGVIWESAPACEEVTFAVSLKEVRLLS